MKRQESRFQSRKNVLWITAIAVITAFTFSVKAASLANVYIDTSEWSDTSVDVGLGTAASFFATNYSSSTGTMKAEGMACWAGWPYTTEVSTNLKAGQNATLTDSQSQSSSFKIRLTGYCACNGYGRVTVTQ